MAFRFGTALRRSGTIEVCDRCGIRAHLHVVLLAGGELYFCDQHAREHRQALKHVAFSLQDIPV